MSFTLRVGVGQGEWRADARAHATLTSCWEENHSGEGKVSMSKVDELELAEGKKKKKKTRTERSRAQFFLGGFSVTHNRRHRRRRP